jgi:hypothetical protein
MANEIDQKILVAAAALDFDTGDAAIDSLPDGDLCWCAPVTTMTTASFAEVIAAIKMGTTPTAGGTVEFYEALSDGTLQQGTNDITLSDHGTEGTAADVQRVLGAVGPPIGVITVDATTDIVYTSSFKLHNPGGSYNILIYNNTGATLNSAGHSVRATGWGPEVQD